MKLIAAALTLAAFFAAADAACPNACSGHGNCGTDDQCTCWSGFSGYDCSSRDCPVVEAWILDDSNPHDYAECANRGICNRDAGTCDCFDGFVGQACQRTVCPNECSGRGKCRLMADLPNYSPQFALDWDAKAITGCVCDPGFMGPDCSQRICLHGDDPMTACDSEGKYETQEMTVTMPFGDELRDNTRTYIIAWEYSVPGDDVEVTFSHGGTVSSSIQIDQGNAASEIESELEGSPLEFDDEQFDVACDDTANVVTCTIVLHPEFFEDHADDIAFDDVLGITIVPDDLTNPNNADLGIVWAAAGQKTSGSVKFVDGDFAVVLDTFANETLFTQGVNDIFISDDDTTENDLTSKLQALPLSRARGMTVKGKDNATPANRTEGDHAVTSTYEFTFGGSAVGTQRALQCAYSQSVNGISTFGCPFEGCQPIVKQAQMLQRTGVCSNDRYGSQYSSINDDLAYVEHIGDLFTVSRDGLLGCPVDVESCANGNNDEFQAGVDVVFFKEDDELWSVYAKGVGNDAVETGKDSGPVENEEALLDDEDLVFLGQIRKDSIKNEEIDLGRIVPTLKITVSDNAGIANLEDNCVCAEDECPSGGEDDRLPITFSLRYNVASCSSGETTVPADDNVEFIECSGRGQCDRGNGLCQCFEGYHGAACDEQNVLV